MPCNFKNLIIAVCAALFLAACGTTSALQSPSSGEKQQNASKNTQTDDAKRPDLSAYTAVVIGEFKDATENAEKANSFTYGEALTRYLRHDIKKKGIFSSVKDSASDEESTESQEKTLLIEGDVTRYQEGNKALRMLVGLGAGSSYFDADILFKDRDSGETLGVVKVDKNSWVLGGVMAAQQDIDSHIRSASTKIADELAAAKNTQ